MLIDAAMEANASLSNATAIEAVSQSICWVMRAYCVCHWWSKDDESLYIHMYYSYMLTTIEKLQYMYYSYMLTTIEKVAVCVLFLYADYYRKSCSMCK